MTRPMDLATQERRDLTDFLTTLDGPDLDRPSLCEGWSVKDVVAHVVDYDTLIGPQLVRRLLNSHLRLSRANPVGIDDARDKTPEELIATLQQHLRPHGLTTAFGGRIGLSDSLIHHQDIRRALNRPRTIPSERSSRP